MQSLSRLSNVWRIWIATCLTAPSLVCGQTSPASTKPEPGLILTYTATDAKASDVVITPNFSIYVPSGKSPSPFLPGGKFSADWSGSISVEKRGNYLFQADLNGALKLEINGQVVLDGNTNGLIKTASPVQLSKGANVIKAQFSSPAEGDAFVRVKWQPKDSFMHPVPVELLGHPADATEPKLSAKLHHGRELFIESRCAKCHEGPTGGTAIPELAMDAPSFEGIGSRRNYEWMVRWIQDPKALRPTAHMPKVLHGSKAREDAESIATFLMPLKGETASPSKTEPNSDQISAGKNLFESLHCVACHNPNDGAEQDAKKISLKQVGAKFAGGSLATFLLKPDAHYSWIRMPNFKLSQTQAEQLAAYLISTADKPATINFGTAVSIDEAKKLVQTAGCLNCHSSKLENQSSAKAMAKFTAEDWKKGCLAEKPDNASKAPQFAFTAEEREALQAFGATDRSSLNRHVETEFAERQTRLLQCRECHGKFEGFPAFDVLGGKLQPEWAKKFISGEIAVKPRPWLDARMPVFHQRAESIAQGLAMSHGYPPQTPTEGPIDLEKAKIGQKLVSAAGGFSCVSCHSVGDFGATQVFESAGINLALTGSRLLHSYMHSWVRNPQLIDPTTKMPVYFDEEGKSPFADILEGDATKQIEAVWQYLRQGDKMPPPPQ